MVLYVYIMQNLKAMHKKIKTRVKKLLPQSIHTKQRKKKRQ